MRVVATIEDLLCMHHVRNDLLDRMHVSVCRNSLGQLMRQRPATRSLLQRDSEALEPLVQQTVRKADAGELDARGLANTAHAAAHSGMDELRGVLLAALARAV